MIIEQEEGGRITTFTEYSLCVLHYRDGRTRTPEYMRFLVNNRWPILAADPDFIGVELVK